MATKTWWPQNHSVFKESFPFLCLAFHFTFREIMVSGSVILVFIYRILNIHTRSHIWCQFHKATVQDSPKYYLITVYRNGCCFFFILFNVTTIISIFFISCAHYPNECVTRRTKYRLKQMNNENHQHKNNIELIDRMWEIFSTCMENSFDADEIVQNAKHLNVLQMIIIVD